MNITNLKVGDVYLPNEEIDGIFAQIGVGGDCGIFQKIILDGEHFDTFLFRVLVNAPDFKKRWKNSGNDLIRAPLSDYAWYTESEIGSKLKYKVSLESVDNRIIIDKEEYELLEPLAVWQTSHLFDRISNLIGK